MYQGGYMNEPLEGYIEPDTRLQAIADAWDFCPLARDEMRHSNVTLARLLDALTKEEPDHDSHS